MYAMLYDTIRKKKQNDRDMSVRQVVRQPFASRTLIRLEKVVQWLRFVFSVSHVWRRPISFCGLILKIN